MEAYLVPAIVVMAILAIFALGRIRTILVNEYEHVLHYHKGRFVAQLPAGIHRFFGSRHEFRRMQARWSEMIVQGQEVLTGDKASLKMSLIAIYRITDPRKAVESSESHTQILYTAFQLALREAVGSDTIDELLEARGSLGPVIHERVAPTAEELGLELREVAIRDFLIGGGLRQAFESVFQARQAALANVERARGEAAAMRSLANTAKLVEKNPDILKLRYLELVEKASERGSHQLVIGDPESWIATQKSSEGSS